MPHYCIVPLCKNISATLGISFYRLLLKDPELLKKWLIKIRRENTPITEYSRVCSSHFNGGKKKFALTKLARPPPRSQRAAFSNAISNEVDNFLPMDNLKVVATLVLDDTSPAITSAADTCGTVDRHCVGIDVDTQTIRDVINVKTQTTKMTCLVAVQYSPDYDHQSTQTHFYTFGYDHQSTQTEFSTLGKSHQSTQTDRYVSHVGTMTDGEVDIPPFSVEQIKDDDQAIKFYTGFYTFAAACFYFLGPAVTNLCYGQKK